MGNSLRIRRLLLAGTAGAAFAVAPVAVSLVAGPPSAQAQPCYSGYVPGNPYVRSCTIPGPTEKIRGSAPDANAIIACRDRPGCLPYYVNNP
jgi:hypothetical protein